MVPLDFCNAGFPTETASYALCVGGVPSAHLPRQRTQGERALGPWTVPGRDWRFLLAGSLTLGFPELDPRFPQTQGAASTAMATTVSLQTRPDDETYLSG